ncbi:hypothetical protein M8J75_007698 [Diaphorina citri]|nr:hypothetical protein M8J75_007698 [Diaphorina citri]
MSCPEVVYQAYYPYLYQRPPATATSAARSATFPHFPHQYDRFNVQRTLEQPSTPSHSQSSDTYHPHSSHHSSAGSISSGGGGVGSPESPPPRHSSSKEEVPANSSSEGLSSRNLTTAADDDEDDEEVTSPGGSRAQYVSANCVVFTHYSGDVESVVDEHFSRALSCTSATSSGSATESKTSTSTTKECSPLTSRNLPASFWNSNYQGAGGSVTPHHGDFYSDPMYHSPSAAASDPWHTHYQQYTAAAHHHHRAVHEYHHHHHNMAAQYSSLLLPPTSRLPHQYHHSKTGVEPWTSGHSHHRLHHDQASSIDPAATYTTYSTMAGLEAQVQESSKDLYWF